MKKTSALLLVAVAVALCAGCSTSNVESKTGFRFHNTVKFDSEPQGAFIRYRGAGRGTFRWKDTEPRTTPTQATDVRYSKITAYACWPDGTKSEQLDITLSNWGDPKTVIFVKPSTSK